MPMLRLLRRSSREPGDAEQPFYRSPYRCRDCRTKFWAFSHKLLRRIVVISIVTVISLVAVALIAIFGLGGSPFGMNSRGSRVAVILHPFQRVAGVTVTLQGAITENSPRLPPKAGPQRAVVTHPRRGRPRSGDLQQSGRNRGACGHNTAASCLGPDLRGECGRGRDGA